MATLIYQYKHCCLVHTSTQFVSFEYLFMHYKYSLLITWWLEFILLQMSIMTDSADATFDFNYFFIVFMNFSGILGCGDDDGSIWLYRIEDLTEHTKGSKKPITPFKVWNHL